MSYIQDTLGKDESVKYQSRISLWSLLGWLISGGFTLLMSITIFILAIVSLDFAKFLVGLAFLLAPAAIFGIAYMYYISIELAITNKRVIAKTGFISRDTSELPLNKVEGVNVKQSLLGRMLNYGTVIVSGTGSTPVSIKNIKDPLEFRRQLQQAAGL